MQFVGLLVAFNLLACWPVLADGGYLFATFKGEQTPMSEQVYFVASTDGHAWTALNGGRPVLVSTVGEHGVRDPYLLRAHDGKTFFLLATDLSVHLNPDWGRAATRGSRSIVVWESADLVHWSAPRLAKVSPDDAGCTWAPEAVYDEQAGDYLVFWASRNARDGFAKHRVWATRTKDFKTFGRPFVYIDQPHSVIDTDVVHDRDAYYRFTKNEDRKTVTMERGATLAGPWQPVPGFSLADRDGFEGPQCYPLRPADGGGPTTWCLVMDHFATNEGYQSWVTHDLADGRFEPGQGFVFPFRLRHGSVLPVSTEEVARLRAAYP